MKTFTNLLLAALFSLVCNVAQGQISADTVIPEFETIIKDAEKAGKDPIDVGLGMGITESEAVELDAYIIKKRMLRISEKKKEAAEREVRIAKLDKELTDKGVRLINIFTGLKKEGKFTQKEMDILNRMYKSTAYPPEIKQIIKERFPEILSINQ